MSDSAILVLKGMGMGESGIWWSIPAGWGIGMILTIIYYKTGKWKTKTVIKASIEPATVTR